jgi:cell division initiation protein
MKIAPMEIQKQQFGRRFRGYDRDEVRSYLHLVAEDVAEMHRDHSKLEAEVASLRSMLEEHRQRETILKNTLLMAQKASDEIKESARRQRDTIVKEAEFQADRVLERAQGRAHELEQRIIDLKVERSNLRSDVRALVERVVKILDLHEEAERQDNLHFLKPRQQGGA